MGPFNHSDLNSIHAALNRREAHYLSEFAVQSSNGLRQTAEPRLKSGYRQPFAVDVDRILHSRAYARYIDKTQVFYLIENDHITHRVLHVQLVSKIARTIGRFLGLNEDLIEAIALGHDIGHAPFGHDGERFLSSLCDTAGIGCFLHNVQSVQFLDRVERKGRGWNLCLQTLDGIVGHDGEIHNEKLVARAHQSFDGLKEILESKKKDPDLELRPMSLEGCVVRMADTISYIGRDIEDAIRLRVIKRKALPQKSVKLLGDTNGTIVYNLVTDIIKNSYQKPYIAFSPEISTALKDLKDFNLSQIYLNPKIKKHTPVIKELFALLFERYLSDIEKGNGGSAIFTRFLKEKSAYYIEAHRPAEIVRDFLSGMTDSYFLRQCPAHLRPKTANILE
jgi:dGTPase